MTLDSNFCLKKISTICLNWSIYTRYFRSGRIYVQNWRVRKLLKCILAYPCLKITHINILRNVVDVFGTLTTWRHMKTSRPCLTWHFQPIKSAEHNQRETTIVSDWKPYLQQYTKILKTPTLQTYFSLYTRSLVARFR
jgi:hypothetical protein